MRKHVLIALFISNISFGQGILLKPGHGIDDIKFGYSTRYDVKEHFGTNYDTLPQSFIPPFDEGMDNRGLVENDQLIYKNLGIHFICGDNDQLIRDVLLVAPFKCITKSGLNIEIGKTTIDDVFGDKELDSTEINYTYGSLYISIQLDSIIYYVAKDISSRQVLSEKVVIYGIKPFKQSIAFYRNQKIKYIQIAGSAGYDLYTGDNRYTKDRKDSSDYYFRIPYYAPDSEKHLNCSKHRISRLRHLITELGIQMNSDLPPWKEGFWKVYYPNHIMAYEGNYKNDKPIGVFKYYDFNGKHIKVVDYDKRGVSFYILIMIVLICIMIAGAIIIFNRRRKIG